MAAILNANEKAYRTAIEKEPDLVNLDQPELSESACRIKDDFTYTQERGCIKMKTIFYFDTASFSI